MSCSCWWKPLSSRKCGLLLLTVSIAAGRVSEASGADVRALEAAREQSAAQAATWRAHSSAARPAPARAVTPSGFSATASPADSKMRAEPRDSDSARGLSRSSKLSVEFPRPKRLSDVGQAEQTLSPRPPALSCATPRSPPPTTAPNQLAQSISNWAGRIVRDDGSRTSTTAQHAGRDRVEARPLIPQGGRLSPPPRALQPPSHHSPPHSENKASWSAPFFIELERTPTATMASPTGPFAAELHGVGIRFTVTDSGLVIVTGILEGAAAAKDARIQVGVSSPPRPPATHVTSGRPPAVARGCLNLRLSQLRPAGAIGACRRHPHGGGCRGAAPSATPLPPVRGAAAAGPSVIARDPDRYADGILVGSGGAGGEEPRP